MERFVSPELIRNYLAGKCTPREVARIREWYDSFEQETDPIDSLSPQERAALKEMMYTEVMRRLRSRDALPRPALFRVRRRQAIIWGAAATLLLFIGVTILFDQSDLPVTVSPSAENTAEAEPGPEAKALVVENRLRTIKRQTLSDGSVVWLQPETWISFPRDFAPDKREVSMSGEAFFEVRPDASRPFTVYSGDLVTRVLGTSFNVKAYKDGSSAEVSVFTGKVSVSLPSGPKRSRSGELLLAEHEKAVFLQSERLLRKQSYNTNREPILNIWKKNTISFNNTPVKEVVKVLNEEFAVSLKVSEADTELNDYMLKADFTNQNLPDILQMLEKSLSLTYEIEGKEIILKLDK